MLWIDRQEFEREAEAALAALAAAHDGAPLDIAVSSARHALRLYRGAFLPNDVYAD